MTSPFQQLAQRLDALPNSFPPAPDGAELRLLEKLYTAEEATLAAQLRLTLETPAQIAARIGGNPKTLRTTLKKMARRGLITAGKCEGGLGYGLMPFVVGIYEMQISRMDAELARLFEDYYHQAFGQAASTKPQAHRVIPINQAVKTNLEIRPYESATAIVNNAQSWGMIDCICRLQKASIGEPCSHPIDLCMVFSDKPGAFDNANDIQALTREEALAAMQRAAEAGLVHSVSNNQKDLWYICNCCTCSCGFLRAIAELGIADVIAHSAFMVQVDENLCQVCGNCLDACQFGALSLSTSLAINKTRCVGCGLCTPTCPEEALTLTRRPGNDRPPETEQQWRIQRATIRGLDLEDVL